MPETILLANYDRKWPEMFQEAKKALVAAVGSHVEQIEHIGSTSVPDLAAKPVIDILIGVDPFAEELPVVVARKAGYVDSGSVGLRCAVFHRSLLLAPPAAASSNDVGGREGGKKTGR